MRRNLVTGELVFVSPTADEILEDYKIHQQCIASYNRSVDRRQPPKHESRMVANILDEYHDQMQRLGNMVISTESMVMRLDERQPIAPLGAN